VTAPPGDLVASSNNEFVPGSKVVVSIRPEQITMVDDPGASVTGAWKAEVTARGFMGDVVEHELKVGDLVLRMRCNPEVSIPRGDQVMIKLPARWCTLIAG
jgi:ABC-type Fe3+/spermidine/putrescine transport system ATPase subunit